MVFKRAGLFFYLHIDFSGFTEVNLTMKKKWFSNHVKTSQNVLVKELSTS